MAKRKPLGDIEKDEGENVFSMHVLHERPRQLILEILCGTIRPWRKWPGR